MNNNQFGFLQGRSTITQLLSMFNDLAKSRNLSIVTDVIFLDLAEAFDSVPHERLLLKLKRCLLNWPKHFLIGRKQRLSSGEGTILGPLLFLLYINDITEHVSCTI